MSAYFLGKMVGVADFKCGKILFHSYSTSFVDFKTGMISDQWRSAIGLDCSPSVVRTELFSTPTYLQSKIALIANDYE